MFRLQNLVVLLLHITCSLPVINDYRTVNWASMRDLYSEATSNVKWQRKCPTRSQAWRSTVLCTLQRFNKSASLKSGARLPRSHDRVILSSRRICKPSHTSKVYGKFNKLSDSTTSTMPRAL